MKLKTVITVVGLLFALPYFSWAAPAIPTGLSLQAGNRSVTATWNANTDIISGYYIYYGASATDLSNRLTISDRATTTYTISGLDAGKVYYVALAAYDSVSISARTSSQSVSTNVESNLPAAPTGFNIVSWSHITETSVSVTWDPNSESDLSHYKLYYGLTSGSYSSFVETQDKNLSSYTLEGLSPSSRYFLKLCAVNTAGDQSGSCPEIIVDTLTDQLPPYIPTNLTVKIAGQDRITVTFATNNDKMVDFIGCHIYYWDESALQEQLSVDVKDSHSHTFTNLPRGKTMVFAVSAYDYWGNESMLTNSQSIVIEAVHSLLSQEDDFSGGCYIDALIPNANSNANWPLMLGVGFLTLLLWIVNKLHKPAVWLCAGLILAAGSVASAQTTLYPAEPNAKNSLSLMVGYFYAQEELHRDMYDENTLPVTLGYARKLFSVFSADLEIGYLRRSGRAISDSGAETGIETTFTLIPASASIIGAFQIQPLISAYIGSGVDYWYYRETTDYDTYCAKDDGEYGVSGYHGKIGLKLFTGDEAYYKRFAFVVELRYSRIDRWGQNNLDLGGWTVNLGANYFF